MPCLVAATWLIDPQNHVVDHRFDSYRMSGYLEIWTPADSEHMALANEAVLVIRALAAMSYSAKVITGENGAEGSFQGSGGGGGERPHILEYGSQDRHPLSIV